MYGATCHYQVLLNLVLWSCGSYQPSPLTMQTGPPLCVWENMALSSQKLSSYLIPATKESSTEGFLSSELLQTLFSTMNLYSNVAGANVKTIKLNYCTMNQLQQSRSFARSIDIPIGCRELHLTRTPVYEMTKLSRIRCSPVSKSLASVAMSSWNWLDLLKKISIWTPFFQSDYLEGCTGSQDQQPTWTYLC